MDVADITGDRIDREMEMHRKIVAARMRGKRELDPTGSCHFCTEAVAGDKLFCDAECSADWNKHNNRR